MRVLPRLNEFLHFDIERTENIHLKAGEFTFIFTKEESELNSSQSAVAMEGIPLMTLL